MSFSMTTEAVRRREKTVTRRLGWDFLKPGDLLWACEKCQGLKKGEKVKRICLIRVRYVRREDLDYLLSDYCYPDHDGGPWDAEAEMVREGFPDKTPEQFVEMFCRANNLHFREPCWAPWPINRIEFEYTGGGGEGRG